MTPPESAPHPPHAAPPVPAAPAFVRVSGEHDLSTAAALTATLGRAMADHDGDLVIDMSRVTFLDASTVGVLVGTRRTLRRGSRALTVRSPSRCTRRILDICDLADLIAGASRVDPVGQLHPFRPASRPPRLRGAARPTPAGTT